MTKWRDLDSKYKEVAALSDYQELCRITINPDGTFEIPSELKGKIAQLCPETRHALAGFFREVAERLESPAIAEVPKKKSRAA
jgi:hypothetical protein